MRTYFFIAPYFSNSTMCSERYAPKSEYLKNKRARLPSRKQVFLLAMSSGVFMGCKDGYHKIWPGRLSNNFGLLHFWELSPLPKSGLVLKEMYNSSPSQEGPSTLPISITQQLR